MNLDQNDQMTTIFLLLSMEWSMVYCHCFHTWNFLSLGKVRATSAYRNAGSEYIDTCKHRIYGYGMVRLILLILAYL